MSRPPARDVWKHFKLEGFSAALCAELERKVNAVLDGDHAVTSYYLPEAEFRQRDDLLRTLVAKPPVSQGQVRVVEIQGFDAQACGGAHVSATPEVGRFSIFRTENNGWSASGYKICSRKGEAIRGYLRRISTCSGRVCAQCLGC